MEKPNLTFVYKTKPTENSLDFFLPPSPSNRSLRALLYFHGGGLTAGTRKSWFPSWMKDRAMKFGWIFMSADYSLLCPATSHHVLEDVKDLFSYIHGKMNQDLERSGISGRIDSNSIAVAGSSAGGFCAYLAALHANPKPRVVLSLYGLGGNLLTPQYLGVKSKPFFMNREMLNREDFKKFLYPFPQSLEMTSGSECSYFPSNHPTKAGWPNNPRMPLCRLLLQLGEFLDYHTGEHEPSLSDSLRSAMVKTDDPGEDAIANEDRLRSLIPETHWQLFPQLLVDQAFPPTFLIHGKKDTAVLLHESENMKRLINKHKGVCEIYIVQDEEHSFDYRTDAEVKYSELFDKAFKFLQTALNRCED